MHLSSSNALSSFSFCYHAGEQAGEADWLPVRVWNPDVHSLWTRRPNLDLNDIALDENICSMKIYQKNLLINKVFNPHLLISLVARLTSPETSLTHIPWDITDSHPLRHHSLTSPETSMTHIPDSHHLSHQWITSLTRITWDINDSHPWLTSPETSVIHITDSHHLRHQWITSLTHITWDIHDSHPWLTSPETSMNHITDSYPLIHPDSHPDYIRLKSWFTSPD